MIQHRSAVVTSAAAVVVALTFTACSSDQLAESFIERQLGAEGADVELSGGQIRIQTDEGTVEMTTGDDGSVRIRSEGADGTETVIESDGNDVVMSSDGDSRVVASASATLPADFPADFPLPDASLVNASRTMIDGAVSYSLVFEAPGAVAIDEYERMASALRARGFEVEFESTDSSSVTAKLGDGTTDVIFSGGHDQYDDISRFGVVITPAGT